MTKALEETFPNCTTRADDERRKFWKLNQQDARLMLAQGVRESELTALELSIRRAERDGAANEVKALSSLRDRLLAAMLSSHARRVEADAEAMLEAYGFASRFGPRVRGAEHLLGVIAQALKGPHLLTIRYTGRETRERRLEPRGLLLGTRRYLVAREARGDGRMQHFRLDRIAWVQLGATQTQARQTLLAIVRKRFPHLWGRNGQIDQFAPPPGLDLDDSDRPFLVARIAQATDAQLEERIDQLLMRRP